MTSVACPHCKAKIRLTHKKSSSNDRSRNGSLTNQTSREFEQKPEKARRLPVPEIADATAKIFDTVDSKPPNLDSSEQPAQSEPRESKPDLDTASDLADDLLPPKFLVPDIEADENAVVLPSADGGFQVVDKTAIRVMHEGRPVELVSLSPAELKRVRLIENLVALLIAGIMLAIAAWLVL